jgi:hypothetical protein
MFGLFKKATQRTKFEGEIRDLLWKNFSIELNKVGGWKLAKVTDSYFEDIEKYPSANDNEEFVLYLMLLHDARLFDLYDNEVLLTIVIKFLKLEESKMSADGYTPMFRKEIKDRINEWIHANLLK